MTLREFLCSKSSGLLLSAENKIEWILINPLKNMAGKLFRGNKSMFFNLKNRAGSCSKWMNSKIKILNNNVIECDKELLKFYLTSV